MEPSEQTILCVYGMLLAYNGDRPDHLINIIRDEITPAAKQIIGRNNKHEDR